MWHRVKGFYIIRYIRVWYEKKYDCSNPFVYKKCYIFFRLADDIYLMLKTFYKECLCVTELLLARGVLWTFMWVAGMAELGQVYLHLDGFVRAMNLVCAQCLGLQLAGSIFGVGLMLCWFIWHVQYLRVLLMQHIYVLTIQCFQDWKIKIISKVTSLHAA